MKFTTKRIEKIIFEELNALLLEKDQDPSTYAELRDKLESELKALKAELAEAKKAAKKIKTLEKKIKAKQAQIDRLMDSIPSGGDGSPIKEQASGELDLGPEFGPRGQLDRRLSAPDPEDLNRLANAVSSYVGYMLEYPQAGEGDQNISELIKVLKELLQYTEMRSMGLLDPDRPVQGGPVQDTEFGYEVNPQPGKKVKMTPAMIDKITRGVADAVPGS